jgi:hypothetical protein
VWGRGKTPHNIHIHVNHIQYISFTPDNGGEKLIHRIFRSNRRLEGHDSLAGKSIVRYKMDTFSGEIVLHCHFLFHEDMGMMATIYSGSQICAFPSQCSANGTNLASSNSSLLISNIQILIIMTIGIFLII